MLEEGRLNNQQALEGTLWVLGLLTEDVARCCFRRENRQCMNGLGEHNLAGEELFSLLGLCFRKGVSIDSDLSWLLQSDSGG